MVATVSQERWRKAQASVAELRELLEAGPLPMIRLEKIRGFLIYVARTYSWMPPFLKSLHLVIDSWRPNRDSESGWENKYLYKDEDGDWRLEGDSAGDAPETVDPTGALREMFEFHLTSLSELLGGEEPAIQYCRAEGSVTALYLWGDASGASFGSLLHETSVEYESAEWARDHKEESSNWREMNNLTTRVERMADQGRLRRKELTVITDNDTFYRAFHKGHSSSPKLNNIVFRLHRVARVTGAIIHVVHVAGTRLKEAGIDGLSRGDFMQGIMSGKQPLEYLPLNEGADERSGGLVEKWVNSWWTSPEMASGSANSIKLLSPEDWFTLYENKQPRLWCPPPAAMETVIELFNDDRLVHPGIPHVFCVPRLMTHLWERALGKDADLMFHVKAGTSFWPKGMHEPLIILLVLPLRFVPHYRGPWVMRGTDRAASYKSRLVAHLGATGADGAGELHELEGGVCGMRKGVGEVAGDILREFLVEARGFRSVHVRGVRRMLQTAPEGQLRNSKRTRRR